MIGAADVTIARPARTAGQKGVAVETHSAFLAMETWARAIQKGERRTVNDLKKSPNTCPEQ